MRDSYVMLQNAYGTPEMRKIWEEENMVQKWLDYEAVITSEQVKLGLVPKWAGDDIISKSTVKHLPPQVVAQWKGETGHIMVGCIKAFANMCGPAGEYYHLGPTTQDIVDTGLTIQIREAYQLLMKDLLKLEEVLVNLAKEHRTTVMMGRTHHQHAVPLTFGFKVAMWASEIRDDIDRMREMEKRLFVMKLTAAVGSRNTFAYLLGVEKTLEFCNAVAKRVDLTNPPWDPSSRTDRFAELTFNLALLCSTLAEMGLQIRDYQTTEIGELAEPWDPSKQYSSSTMPGKRNPEPSEWQEGLAKMARSNALAMMDIQMVDERDATRMGVEFACIPENFLMAHAAVRTAIRVFSGLEVHKERMRENLYFLQGTALGEVVMLKLWQKTGKKVTAHTLVHDATMKAMTEKKLFKDALLEMPEVKAFLSPEEIDEITNPEAYIGTAPQQVDAVVKYIEERRKEQML